MDKKNPAILFIYLYNSHHAYVIFQICIYDYLTAYIKHLENRIYLLGYNVQINILFNLILLRNSQKMNSITFVDI